MQGIPTLKFGKQFGVTTLSWQEDGAILRQHRTFGRILYVNFYEMNFLRQKWFSLFNSLQTGEENFRFSSYGGVEAKSEFFYGKLFRQHQNAVAFAGVFSRSFPFSYRQVVIGKQT